jgi:CHASE2 domain-containing sensor protein
VKDWKAMKYFTLATVALLYVSFLFSIRTPLSHTFYITLPVAMLYSFYCWNEFLKQKSWQNFALVFIICGFIFNIGLAVNNYSRASMYLERDKVVEAIKARDYRILGERRAGSRY